MRILMLSQLYPNPYDEVNGIFVHNQTKELLKKGCKVVVVSPVRYMPPISDYVSQRWMVNRKAPKSLVWEGVQIHLPRYPLFPHAWLFETSGYFMHCGIRRVVEKIHNEFHFDLIHAHVALPDGFAALMLKQKYGVPVIVTIHGADLHSTIHRNKRCHEAVGKVLEQADHIVMVSTKLKKIAINHYEMNNMDKKITTIANGVFPFDFPKREKVGKQKIMLSVSNLIRSKGIDLNLHAFAVLKEKYPELVYKIVGDGPDLGRLKVIVSSLNIDEDRVIFTGRLPHHEVMKQMLESDIFSLPSWEEGFGVVYIEAMSQGKPVIACKGEGIEDVIVHKSNGFLVKPRDLNSLIEMLDYIINNPEVVSRIGKEAQRTVLDNYTWEKNAEKTIRLYKHVLSI